MDKAAARMAKVAKSLTAEEGRREIASDERSDYDYPKTEDDWPTEKLPTNTPVGRQAQDASSLDQQIYKTRRENKKEHPKPPSLRDADFSKLKERLRVNDREAGKLARAAKNRLGSTTRRNR